MKNKILSLFAFTALVIAFIVVGVNATTFTMSQWDLTANASSTTSNSNLVASSLTAGPGLTNFAGATFTNGVTTDIWSTAPVTSANVAATTNYYQVTLTPNAGVDFVINSLSFLHQATSTGMNFVVYWSKDSFVTSSTITSTPVTSSATSTQYSNTAINIPVSAGETITFRIYGYDTTATDTFSVKTLKIQGDIVPLEAVDCVTTTNNANHLSVKIDDLSVEEGFGSDTEWFPLDTISTRINVENNGNEKMKSIVVRWGLFNQDTQDWVVKEKETSFTLKDGDNKDLDFQFKLDKHVNDLTDGNYLFFAIADAKDAASSDIETCEMDSEKVTIISESNFVILDNMQYQKDAQCLQEVPITADVWNVGSEDQNAAYIKLNNVALGINDQKMEIGDVNSLDSSTMSYSFIVPKGTAEKTYIVDFTIYDDNDDVFVNDYNDDEAVFHAYVNVKGNCAIAGKVSVEANLESSSVVAGKEMNVKVTLKNTGDKTADYTVSADGYSSWASSATVDQATFNLDAGQSKDVTLTLNVKDGASGDQKFNINVLSAGTIITTQPVATKVQGGFFSALSTSGSSGGNFLWIVGALNVILVLAIIVIAVRFFSR